MARKLFEFRATRARAGGLASGIAYIVWDDEAATVLADISTTLGGSSIAGSTVTTADIAGLGPSACRFYGPTDAQDTLWVTCPSDPTLGVQRVEASTDARLDALESGSASGIPGTILDAKGDIIAASAADTAARLAVGANDTVLTADSTTSTGLKWAAGGGSVAAHEADTTAIHGITDTSQIALRNAANTFTADNLFRSGRPWVDVRAYGTNTAAIDTAWAAAVAAGSVLYFSAGTDYTYSGTGLSHTSIACVGAGAGQVTITLGAGTYLFKPSVRVDSTHIEGITVSGGKGLFQHTYTGNNVAFTQIIKRCKLLYYTECAISSDAADMPYWRIEDNVFYAFDDTNTIGVALNETCNNSAIRGNAFLNNRVDIKSRMGGVDTYILNNDFIHFEGSPSVARARIWYIPGANPATGGTGAVVRDNKFGNENLAATDYNILYADEGAGATNSVKMPSLAADSTGYILSHHYAGNKISGGGASSQPFVYSTTPHVQGCNFGPNAFDGTTPSYLLQFRTVPGPDRAIATNVLGPVLNSSLAIEVAAVPASNATWLGPVLDPTAQLDVMVGSGHQPIPGAGDLAGYVNLLTTGVRSFANPYVLTLTNVADSVGGADATEVTFTSASGVFGQVTTTPTANKPAFLEFDLKAGSSSPMASVDVLVQYDDASAIFTRRIPKPPASGWARYRIPLKFATVGANIIVSFNTPTGLTGKIQIGRVRLYHAGEPVNIDGVFPGEMRLAGAITIGSDVRTTYGVAAGSLPPSVGALAGQSWAGSLIVGVLRAHASQTARILECQDSAGAILAGVEADGKLKFGAGNEAATVGAGGGATPPPSNPSGYFLVKDSAGNTRKIPYYAS